MEGRHSIPGARAVQVPVGLAATVPRTTRAASGRLWRREGKGTRFGLEHGRRFQGHKENVSISPASCLAVL